jgi:sulfur transfer protein SufE
MISVYLPELGILAVQNWFYNLFARFVDDCEDRMVKGLCLISLHSFAQEKGQEINPFHPAFFLAALIVATIAYELERLDF